MLISLIALSGYTQVYKDTVKCYNKHELEKISLSLIQGKECCELLDKTNKEVLLLNHEIELLEVKNTLCDSSLVKLNSNNKILQKNIAESNNKLNKEAKRKRIWRTTAIIAIAGDIILGTILILTK